MDANEAEREEMFDKLWKMGGELSRTPSHSQ